MTNHRQARGFEFLPTRSGHHMSYRVVIRCGNPECSTETEKKYTRVLPDEPVRKHFSDMGWLLGKQRSDDICPSCLKDNSSRRHYGRQKVMHDGRSMQSTSNIVETSGKYHDLEIAQILDHLFGPIKAQPNQARISAPDPIQDTEDQISVLTREVREMRASSELQTEQHQRMIAQNDQIIEVLSRLTQSLLHHQDGVACGLNNAASAMHELAGKAIAVRPKKPTTARTAKSQSPAPGTAAPPPRERAVRSRRASA